MKLFIRKFDIADYDEVQSVLKLTVVPTYLKDGLTEAEILETFKNQKPPSAPLPDNVFRFVALDEKKIVGVMTFIKNDDVITLRQIYVLPEFQGKGVGTALLGKIDSTLFTEREIKLEVGASNLQAINFYLSKGYKKTGEVGQYKVGSKSIPTITMSKLLG